MQALAHEVAAGELAARRRSKARGAIQTALRLLVRGFAVACVFAVTLVTSTAHAEDPSMAKPTKAAARERLTAGNKLYRIREFEKAAEEYKAGVVIEDAPVFYYNLGQCYRQLDRYEDAIWHYERFIERGKPAGEVRAAVDAFVSQLKMELQRKAVVPPPVEPPADAKKPSEPPRPPTVVTVRIPGEPWYRDRLGWGLAGAGVVAVGVGSWFLIDAKGIEADANALAAQSERERLRDRASGRRLTGSIIGGVGLAVLVTGIIKLAMVPADRQETTTSAFSVGASSDTVFVTGRF